MQEKSKSTITEVFDMDEFMAVHSAVHNQKNQLMDELEKAQDSAAREKVAEYCERLEALDNRFYSHFMDMFTSR